MQTERRLFGFTSEQDIRERATYRCDKLLQILLVSYSSHLLFLMSLRTGLVPILGRAQMASALHARLSPAPTSVSEARRVLVVDAGC